MISLSKRPFSRPPRETGEPWRYWDAGTIATVSRCPESGIRTSWPAICAELEAAGQGSMRSLAAAIGTVAIETASRFMPIEEFFNDPPGKYAYFERMYGVGNHPSARDMGHTKPGDGATYFGRGFIQLTWKRNYETYGQRIGVDLVNNPGLALDPAIAAKLFADYWKARDIQEPADREDWRDVRRRVQGGSAGLDRLIQIATGLLQVAKV